MMPERDVRMRRWRWNGTWLCMVLLWAGAAGCTPSCRVVMTDVNLRRWDKPAVVVFPNTDTVSRRTLHLLLRSNEMLDADTLTLRIGVCAPDSLRYEELFLVCILPEPQTAALRRESRIPYRYDVVLDKAGAYRFTFSPVRPVRGIEAVGMEIGNND